MSTAEVTAFRRFNRYFTRRIGVLNDRYLGQNRPLGQARLLFEIGSGVALRELRARLGLDAGYLSRMLKVLEGQGLVDVGVHPEDNRVRVATLTPAGQKELGEQNQKADGLAVRLLDGLDERQRASLIAAMGEVEQLLRLASVRVEAVDPRSADARHCLAAYAAEIRRRFPEGYDDAELVGPDEVTGENGAVVIAYEDGRPIGCGAVRTLQPGVGEIRHVWVDPAARGMGIGRRLLERVEAEAAGRGLHVVRLGTHKVLTEAIAMYRGSGYAEIPRYGEDEHNHHCFERRLR